MALAAVRGSYNPRRVFLTVRLSGTHRGKLSYGKTVSLL
jgi:hypothetical protein